MPIARKRFRFLRIVLAAFLFLTAASLISLLTYGHFARSVKGEPTFALSLKPADTVIDQFVAPLTEQHPEQTGLLLLDDNLDAFAARGLSARFAGRSLDVQYYLWHADLTGKLLGYELTRAADRGVRVRVLLDDLNVHDKDSILAALDRHPNIEVRLFNPSRGRSNSFLRGIELLTRGLMLNRRMHNKAWIADGRIAIVGGRNVGDEYFDASTQGNFFDADLLIMGNAVREAEHIFDDYWNSSVVIPMRALVNADDDTLAELRRAFSTENPLFEEAEPYLQQLRTASSVAEMFRQQSPAYWTNHAHVYADPPEKGLGLAQDEWLIHKLLPAWRDAQHNAHLISPYFVPGKAGVRELQNLVERGVSTSVLTNSLAATDVFMVHGGYAPYRKPLLRGGIELFELKPHGPPEFHIFGSRATSLHTKAFMIDDAISFVGSLNSDPRSVILNTEMGLLFHQPEITQALIRQYEARTSPQYSYHLFLEDDQLRWEDHDEEIPQVWTHEPESSWGRRFAAKIVEWLPVESQL